MFTKSQVFISIYPIVFCYHYNLPSWEIFICLLEEAHMDIYFNFRGTEIHPQSEARAKPVKWDKKKHALLAHDFTFSEMES